MIGKIFIIIMSLLSYGITENSNVQISIVGVSKEMEHILTGYSLLSLNSYQISSDESSNLDTLAEHDSANLESLLRSMGYRGAKVTINIDAISDPKVVYIYTWLGPMYHIDDVEIHTKKHKESKYIEEIISNISAEDLEYVPGVSAASSSQISLITSNLLEIMQNKGLPLSSIANVKIVGNKKSKIIHISAEVDPGPKSFFGQTNIIGNKTISNSFIRQNIKWGKGELFDRSKIYATRSALLKTQLFKDVFISTPNISKETDLCDSLPVLIKIHEANHKNIKLKLFADSESKFVVYSAFEHKNIDSRGGRFNASLSGYSKGYTGALDFTTSSQILEKSVSHNFSFEATNRDYAKLKSYDDTFYHLSRYRTKYMLDMFSGENIYYSVGPSISHQDIDFGKREVVSISKLTNKKSLIFGLSNKINMISSVPSSAEDKFISIGMALDMFADQKNNYNYWIKAMFGTTIHTQPIFNRFLLHFECKAGKIFYRNNKTPPMNELFYLGGLSKPRGYSKRSISPMINSEPVGGNSFLSISSEIWYTYTNNLAISLFFDSANCKNSFMYRALWSNSYTSCGLSAIFITNIGMYIRCDLGIPLKPRTSIDSSWQAYISIGNHSNEYEI